jgi:hypothetical protein
MCKVPWAVERPLRGYNNVLGGLEELYCIVNQGRQRNQGFSREKIRNVSGLPCPYKVSLPSPNTPDQPGHVSFKGGLLLI